MLKTEHRTNLPDERDELAGSPGVRLRQVDVLHVEDQSLAVLGPVHTPGVGGDDHAHLQRWGLCGFVTHGHTKRTVSVW